VIVMETSYLAPDGWFLFWLAVYAVLVIGPAIDAGVQRRWGWVVAIVLLSPWFGILWYMYRWFSSKRQTA
jgi:hypothetical protein